MSEQKLRFLVVTAHPHDFTHAAATCGIHTTRGDSVTVVSVGQGVYEVDPISWTTLGFR